jgi:hypothetical protein
VTLSGRRGGNKLAPFGFYLHGFFTFATAMKKCLSLFLMFLAVIVSGCGAGSNTSEKPKQFPKPGSLILSAEMPVTDDPLNHFTFSVKVYADSSITSGVYDVDAEYGPNFAQGKFTMPKGGEDFKPIIRKGSEPYSYIIGFRAPGDTTFYDYYLVSSSLKTTKMQYIKAYTFN